MSRGTFFDPITSDKHVCIRPPVIGVPTNHWRCDCGKAWARREMYQHGEYWFEWQRTPEFDEEK